jgi:RNA polymerase sigma factor (sigma-70 family)
LLAWLRQVLVHNLTNFARRFRDTAKREIAREIPFHAGIADTSTPSGKAIRKEQVEALERALERLPELHLQVILLRHREQRSFEEIGVLLNTSKTGARTLWCRAVVQLQQELEHPP